MFSNELKEGDDVHVKVGSEWVIGKIVKIQNGGIAVTGVPKNPNDPVGVTMDAFIVQTGVVFNQQPPGSAHAFVMKLDTAKAQSDAVKNIVM
jgi:hypothetical protein